MTTPTEDASLTLSYARRPRTRRWWVIAIALLAVAAGAYYGMRWYRPHFELYQYQRREYAAVPSPGTVIYSEERADIATLRVQPGYTTERPNRPNYDSGGLEPIAAAVWREVMNRRRQSAINYHAIRPSQQQIPVGRLKTTGGATRMIYLQGYPANYDQYDDDNRDLLLPAYTVTSSVSLWPGPPTRKIMDGSGSIRLHSTDRVVLYAPALDPADSSHLTLGYAINGEYGTIDGWLLPNDTMAFRLTTGPATTRPSRGYVAAKP